MGNQISFQEIKSNIIGNFVTIKGFFNNYKELFKEQQMLNY